MNNKTVIISGSGIVGLSTAIGLAQMGYKVKIYEKRDLSDKSSLYSVKRSLKLDISYRGQLLLHKLGIMQDLIDNSIILDKRIYHTKRGLITVDTDKNKIGFYSISHSKIWQILFEKAQSHDDIEIIFNAEVIDFDDVNLCLHIRHHTQEKILKDQATLIIACDGTNSKIRDVLKNKMLISCRERAFDGIYKEIRIFDPENNLDLNSTHFWFKNSGIMLVVHPTLEPHLEGHLFLDKNLNQEYDFSDLDTIQKVELFFSQFKEFKIDAEEILSHPLGKIRMVDQLEIKNLNPNIFLLGDSLHSMVPFLGQGVNCGLEDCYLFLDLIEKYNHKFELFNKLFHEDRIKNSNSIVEMSLKNAPEFSGVVKDDRIMVNRFLDNYFKHKYDWYIPFTDLIYFTNASFTQIEYIRGVQREMLNSISSKYSWIEDINYEFVNNIIDTYKFKLLELYNNINESIKDMSEKTLRLRLKSFSV